MLVKTGETVLEGGPSMRKHDWCLGFVKTDVVCAAISVFVHYSCNLTSNVALVFFSFSKTGKVKFLAKAMFPCQSNNIQHYLPLICPYTTPPSQPVADFLGRKL